MFSTTYSIKTLHKLSYSLLWITLSCKDFLYNLSKGLIVCWSFPYCFLYFLFSFMINLCNTFLLYGKVHTLTPDIGKTIKQTPVIDRFIEVDLPPMIIILSTDSNTVFRVL